MIAHTNQISLKDSTQEGIRCLHELLQKSHLKYDEKIQLKFNHYCDQLEVSTQSFLQGNLSALSIHRNEILRISYEIHHLISIGLKSGQLNETLAYECIKNLEIIRKKVLLINNIYRYANN